MRYLSSKFVAGIFILFPVFLFFLLNIFFPIFKLHLSAIEICLLSPLVFWSVFEIVRLLDAKKHLWKSILFSVWILIAIILTSIILKYPIFLFIFVLISSLIPFFLFLSFSKKYIFVKLLLVLASIFWITNIFVLVHFPKVFSVVFCVTVFSDVFAYLVGMKFGKMKCFNFSKSKTLEGVVIPSIIVFFISFLSTGGNFLYSFYLLLASLIAQMGDLFYSFAKRIFEIKDFGRILGDHGGFWDRFDSHAFVSILLMIFILTYNLSF